VPTNLWDKDRLSTALTSFPVSSGSQNLAARFPAICSAIMNGDVVGKHCRQIVLHNVMNCPLKYTGMI
jgi:hypothetical protein